MVTSRENPLEIWIGFGFRPWVHGTDARAVLDTWNLSMNR